MRQRGDRVGPFSYVVEHSLRRSEGRFRALVQHASDIIMVVTADGTLSYASPAFESILGPEPHGW